MLWGYHHGTNVKEMKIYDPTLGPLPTITRSAMLRVHIDGHGVRFLSLEELARASSFSEKTITWLKTLPFYRAMTIVAGAVPLGMLLTVYRAVVDTLLSLPTISDDCATTIDNELHTPSSSKITI